jgi:hypothetical protein
MSRWPRRTSSCRSASPSIRSRHRRTRWTCTAVTSDRRTRSLITLYVTFFPQLVAGLISHRRLQPLCAEPSPPAEPWDGDCADAPGTLQKVAIADGILAPITEAVYDTTDRPDLINSAWCGVRLAGQIFLILRLLAGGHRSGCAWVLSSRTTSGSLRGHRLF